MTTLRRIPDWRRRLAGRAAAGCAALALLASCGLPFDLGQPSTRALESGAADSLDAAASFRISGSYTEGGVAWTIDLEVVKPSTEHVMVRSAGVNLEAIVIGNAAYFRGREFLSSHMGSDPLSRSRVNAAGDSWWKGTAAYVPKLPEFSRGQALKATWLGANVIARTDHVSAAGQTAIELSGPRSDVFISDASPYRLVRLHMKTGAAIDGITNADLQYSDFDRNFGIVAPRGAIDFADLSTLPPIYTVVSVDTTGCGLTCVVSAVLTNLGGRQGALAPSKVTFTMTDPATNQVLGSCSAEVQINVGYNATTTVSCTIDGINGFEHNAAVVTAVAENPGHA